MNPVRMRCFKICKLSKGTASIKEIVLFLLQLLYLSILCHYVEKHKMLSEIRWELYKNVIESNKMTFKS